MHLRRYRCSQGGLIRAGLLVLMIKGEYAPMTMLQVLMARETGDGLAVLTGAEETALATMAVWEVRHTTL
jgi:hypothetical protein